MIKYKEIISLKKIDKDSSKINKIENNIFNTKFYNINEIENSIQINNSENNSNKKSRGDRNNFKYNNNIFKYSQEDFKAKKNNNIKK